MGTRSYLHDSTFVLKSQDMEVEMEERYETNQARVLRSPIVAKAVIKRNGRFEIIAVFQESTRQEFYWVFRAKAARSPRRAWKVQCMDCRDFNPSFYSDFSSYVHHYARLHQGEVVFERTYAVRRLAALLAQAPHESIFGDWTPQDKSMICTERVQRKIAHGRRGKYFIPGFSK